MLSNLTKHIDFLLKIALQKCGNIIDAQDLCQDTLLSALQYIQKDNQVDNMQAWLITVLNRRYYDFLRRKYKMAVVSYDLLQETMDHFYINDDLLHSEEAEQLHRQIAYLANIYREVIVRHYLNGESVDKIATALNIPVGTVKSRLSCGRLQIKKGFEEMENYTKNSYEPVSLYISNSGNAGMNDEPRSLVEGDLIAQNILHLSYKEPIAENELAKTIGIPMAYIEPIVQKLVDGELMKRSGNRVYTDFIIYTRNDKEKYITAQKQFATDNFDYIWQSFQTLYDKLHNENFYAQLNEMQRNALDLFCFFNVIDFSLYKAIDIVFNSKQVFPDRPNGGRWIAFGNIKFKSDDYNKSELYKYSYAGQRNTFIKSYLGAKQIRLSVFDPDGFPIKIYFRGENGIFDDNLVKLLYIIESGIKFEDTGFDEKYLKSIPWLAECNILRYEDNKPKLNIPVLNEENIKILDNILSEAQHNTVNILQTLVKEFLLDKKIEIPKHLKSVPLLKQYGPCSWSVPMAILRVAMSKGLIHDEGYDNGVQCPYPMIFVVEK